MLALARGLRARGVEQLLVSPAGSALVERAMCEGLRVSPLGGVAKLRGLARDFDIVHAHSGRAQTIAFVATAGLDVKRVATRHVAFEPRHPGVHRLKYSLTCDGIIAVSQAARRTLLSAGVPGAKIEIIATGVEWPATLPADAEKNAARTRWGLAPEDFVAGHMGAFTHEKGQDVAAAAAARFPWLKLILAGDGPLLGSFAASDSLLLPGYVENRTEFFSLLDVFLMPSRSEAWGLAALEAMAHGLPVIASNTGGLPEIVDDGETGWLVAPGDAEALAAAIASAAADRDKLREFGERARERAKRFSVEETAARTEAFYRRLLA